MRRTSPHRVALAALVLLLGCGPERGDAPGDAAAAATPSALELRPGLRISLSPTFLGLGAGLQRWTEDGAGIRRVTVESVESDRLVVRWEERVREETEASRRRREAFEREAPRAGVGEAQPKAPQPEYELRTREGRIAASGLEGARAMTLPVLWPDGEQRVEENSLLWISREAFRELRSTRETAWGLGMLDNPLFQPAAAVEKLREGLDALRERLGESPEERRALDRIEAEADFVEFELTVDGRERQVQAIVARNWFAEYVILDNEENTLILKVTLNPLSGGALDVFSPLAALKSIAGYQVTEIGG